MNMMSKFRIFRKWAGGVSLSFLFFSTVLAPAYASDTEVYARKVDFSSSVTPVLMMVLDSSGSMLFCMDGTGPCPYPKIKRVESLQNAMHSVLFGNPTAARVIKPAPDFIKMGYSRFNPDANDGGWMRYPALKLGSTVPILASDPVTVEARVLNSEDDAVAATPVNTSGTSYKLGSDIVGVRFADLQIPRYAVVSGATLTFFRPDSAGSVPNKLLVKREQTNNAAPYSATNGPDTAFLRSYYSGLELDTITPPNNSWIQGTVSLDVTTQVQNQVKDDNWCGGNAMAFRVESKPGSTATFKAASFDDYDRAASESDVRPRLTVTYKITDPDVRDKSCINAPIDVVRGLDSTLDDVEWAETAGSSINYIDTIMQPGAVRDSVRNQMGLRFDKIQVPSGAKIEKAWLYLTSAESKSVAATVAVNAFATDNIAPFCTQNTTTRAVTCATPTAGLTTATPARLQLPAETVEFTHMAVDVTAQVEEVMSRPGWAQNNAIAFHLAKESLSAASETSLYSVDAGLSKAAILHVVMRQTYEDLDDVVKTARQDLYDDIKVRMYAEGGTPLGDAYAEAARYLLGMAAYSNDTFTSTFSGQAPSQTYTQPDSRTTTTTTSKLYQSPIVDTGECSANYIFMMSDGDPNNASNVNNNSGGITGGYNPDCNAYSKLPVSSGNSNANFACMISVATHLASANNQKKALIRTNTVLFDDDATTGSAVAKDMYKVAGNKETAGKGEFFHAKNESQLTDALLNTLSKTLDETGSITAPGVAVNQFNRLTHLDQLYYAVFDPDTGRSRWLGNVKRYRLAFSETGASIVGRDGKPAIDPSTTFFTTTSQSFWGTGTDGNNALMGGVANRLPVHESRKIFTRIADYTSEMSLIRLKDVPADVGRPLVDGLTVDEQFVNLWKWLYGYDIDIRDDPAAITHIVKKSVTTVSPTTAIRRKMGGVLHSQPVLVNYGYSGSDPQAAQTNPYLQDNALFFSTMEGMLHAVNAGGDPTAATAGVELFAFLPKETLKRAAVYALANAQELPEFGLDVTWTVHRVDGNADLKIDGNGSSSEVDKVWLYGGMRMGGSNYYALNVTNRSTPTLKWVIEGGVTSGFEGMGESWSKPVIGQIKVNDVLRTVLFFGGGYDREHETAGAPRASDAKGNQVYIVDADTRELLWSASATGSPSMTVSDMKFSIPSELKLFDANKDGLVDAVYFGDLGGQVFRLDINNETTSKSGIGTRVQRIANLGQLVTNDVANQRRFYEAPGVAMMYDPVREAPYVAVALGSGYRSHPLDAQTEDAFYVLRDNDVLRPDLLAATDLQATITPTDLAMVDLSSPAGATMTDKMGWMIDLPAAGEKVLASALILFGEVFFTTYTPVPDTDPAQKCKPVIGASTLWRVSATDGAATFDFNKDGTITAEERNKEGIVQGLGGAPQLLIGEDGKNAVITGTGVERNKDLESPTMRRTRWFEKSR